MKFFKIKTAVLVLFLLCGCNDKTTPPTPTPDPTTPTTPTTPTGSDCANLIKDGTEQGIDCGGECNPCHDVIIEQELLIRHSAVVNSDHAKTGSLSFGKLMERLAPNSSDALDLILSLVRSWSTDHTVNGINVAARPDVTNDILSLWADNQGATFNIENGNMDILKAPFRLLAITNRLDLNDVPNKSAGEGRLTFGLTHNGANDFTLIFEYRLEAETANDFLTWTKLWHSLSAIADPTSEEYVSLVVEIVERFTANGSMLNQIRTNEVIGGFRESPVLWELREFNLDGNNLKEVTRKQSPDTNLQESALLQNYATAHSAPILDGSHTVQEEFMGQKFLAGNAKYSSSFRWRLPNGTETSELEEFTKVSCIGCHGGLRSDTRFTHIKPREESFESDISPFLSVDLLGRRDKVGEILQQNLGPAGPPAITPIPPNPRAGVTAVTLSETEINEIRALLGSFSKGKRVH